MIGSSKNKRENYPRKCFWTEEKETRVKFNPGLSANRPSNNWAQSVKRGLVGNTWLFPHAKMLLVPKLFSLVDILYSGFYSLNEYMWILPLFFILEGHDKHIDFLRLLFLVGMICPLMQEHFLRPLLKRKSLPLRLNKSFRLFILLQSASWIWIAKGDILVSVNVMVSFNFCNAGPARLVFSAGC